MWEQSDTWRRWLTLHCVLPEQEAEDTESSRHCRRVTRGKEGLEEVEDVNVIVEEMVAMKRRRWWWHMLVCAYWWWCGQRPTTIGILTPGYSGARTFEIWPLAWTVLNSTVVATKFWDTIKGQIDPAISPARGSPRRTHASSKIDHSLFDVYRVSSDPIVEMRRVC